MFKKACFEGISALKRNFLLVALVGVSLGLAGVLHQPLQRLPDYVDWDTIATLCGLLLITTGLKESNLFDAAAYRISQRIDTERRLALALIFFSAALAMVLTNDIALFIIVPLTLGLQKIAAKDYARMIVLEAIAVNVGSSLTTIGNPQNIFLWHQWRVSFPVFASKMAPLVLIMAACLFVVVFFSFPAAKIAARNAHPPVVHRRLFWLSAVLLIAFVVSVELRCERYFLAIVFLALLWTRRNVIFKTDWGLVGLFIVIFIDLDLFCQIGAVKRLLASLDFHHPGTLFLTGALMSQAISNVPATILLAKYTADFKMLAYGVNVGGNGLLIGSFANLIALRFIQRRRKYWLFHAYSIPFFIVTMILAYDLLI